VGVGGAVQSAAEIHLGVILGLLRRLTVFWAATVTVAALYGCGGDTEQSGFTGLTKIPTTPADFHHFYPSAEMAEEAETLVEESPSGKVFGPPDCVPAKSLEGVGEFNFDCTAFAHDQGRRYRIDVVIHGSNTGEDPGVSIARSLCEPVDPRGVDLPSSCTPARP
jgi:hypothetical protein